MNRERLKELLPVMQAYADGKDIQYRIPPSGKGERPWESLNEAEPIWSDDLEYRVKPREPRKFTIAVSKRDGSAISVHPIGSYPAASWDVIEVVEVIKE